MNNKKWSKEIIFRYILFQLPGLLLIIAGLILLGRLFLFPAVYLLIFVILWIIKDAIVYPFVWRSYDNGNKAHNPLIGEKGIARERIAPCGMVLVRGELWRAKSRGKDVFIEKDETVIVQEINGMTLIVSPTANEPSG